MFIVSTFIASMLLSFSACAGIITDKDSTFGTPENSVTVTINGKLDMSEGKILALTSDQSIAIKSIYNNDGPSFGGGSINDATNTAASAELNLQTLRQEWHFVVVSVDTKVSNGAPTHINSIIIPTALLGTNVDYEMAKHDKRSATFQWLKQPSGAVEDKIQFIFDNVMPSSIDMYGVLRKN
jgi:hypothetical protein